MTAPKPKASRLNKRDTIVSRNNARDSWDRAHQALDELWERAINVSGKELQAERDRVANALDGLLLSAGVSEEREYEDE
jgi:hypothetical protein